MDQTLLPSEAFTIRNVRRDFPEWHRGRPSYVLWALELDSAPVRQRVHAAQTHLADLLLDGYCRQPHVTLSLCGFPSDAPQLADEFGPETLRAQLAALRRGRVVPFETEIGALASFASVPYFAVKDDGGHIAALGEVLCIDTANDDAKRHFTPHVTVGLYADAWAMFVVQARLNRVVVNEPLQVRITGISLLSYCASEIGGVLTILGRYDLDSGAFSGV